MISKAAWISDMPTPSVLQSGANCRFRNAGQCSRMIFSISSFSTPRAASCISRQSGQIEGPDPGGIEVAHERERRLDVGVVLVVGLADLLARDLEVAVVVHVADEVGRDLAHAVARAGHGELPGQVLGQALRARQDVLERVLLGLLLVLARVVRRVEIVLEVGVEVDLLERVALLLGGDRRLRGRAGVLVVPRGLDALGLGRLFLLLEDRVLDDFLGQDLLQLEARHLQQLDRLLQRRRHDQPLGESEVELLLEGHGWRLRL